jgi:hypothetical protein
MLNSFELMKNKVTVQNRHDGTKMIAKRKQNKHTLAKLEEKKRYALMPSNKHEKIKIYLRQYFHL